MKSKLLFICREWFAYVAWQRVEVWLIVDNNVQTREVVNDPNGGKTPSGVPFGVYSGKVTEIPGQTKFNVSHTICELMNGGTAGKAAGVPVLEKGEGCLFVESGESFTLSDFADAIATELGFDYEEQDGPIEKEGG